jgi:hypothetical protein
VVTLVGSLDDLNGLLAGNLHYEPARDFWGQDNLSITTSDQGNTGAGGVLTDSAQIAIQVTAEPDDPHWGSAPTISLRCKGPGAAQPQRQRGQSGPG